MIFFTLYNLPNSTSGIDEIVIQTITAVPSFTPLLLLFVFFVVFFGGVARQIGRTGTADYPMWSTIASLSIFMISLIMTVIEGFIRLEWFIIVIVITIFSGMWLFLDRKTSEV